MANIRCGQTLCDPLRIAPKPSMLENGGQIVYVRDVINVAGFHVTEGALAEPVR